MKAHNMPAPSLPVGKIRVLVVNSDNDAGSSLADTLRTKADYEVQTVRTNFETGLIAQKFAPHVLLVNLFAEGIDATEICRSIRANEDLQSIKIIALANQLNESESAALLQKGFDGYIPDTDDAVEIIKKIEEATAIIY
jgi:DNA-binding response OmpR family regulator